MPHRRYNILTGERVYVSPHRKQRPWKGRKEDNFEIPKLDFDPGCYSCPSIMRANGEKNPNYKDTYCFDNDFATLIPFLIVWSYETMIIPLQYYQDISQLNKAEVRSFAQIIKGLTIMYDNLFETSFPYSSGIHQRPSNGDKKNTGWHFHMSFYPPLLRSATVRKYMVGYEIFAEPQRDLTPELATLNLKSLSINHYLI